jgi:hypothetical protein
MLSQVEKTITASIESELELGTTAPDQCLRNFINFRNQEYKSYENEVGSIYIKSDLNYSYQGMASRRNAVA